MSAHRAAEVVAITGASAGSGGRRRGVRAPGSARSGLIARGEERLDSARREIEELGVRAVIVSADVADADAVEAAAERIEDELGPDRRLGEQRDGDRLRAALRDTEPDEFRRATEVTYLGSVWGTMAALRRMRPRDRA